MVRTNCLELFIEDELHPVPGAAQEGSQAGTRVGYRTACFEEPTGPSPRSGAMMVTGRLQNLFGRCSSRRKEAQIPFGMDRSAINQSLLASAATTQGVFQTRAYPPGRRSVMGNRRAATAELEKPGGILPIARRPSVAEATRRCRGNWLPRAEGGRAAARTGGHGTGQVNAHKPRRMPGLMRPIRADLPPFMAQRLFLG